MFSPIPTEFVETYLTVYVRELLKDFGSVGFAPAFADFFKTKTKTKTP